MSSLALPWLVLVFVGCAAVIWVAAVIGLNLMIHYNVG